MKTIITLLFFLIITQITLAQQARFVNSGSITYEKTVNMFAVLKNITDVDDGWNSQLVESYKKTQPQFKKLQSTLTFSNSKTLYVPTPQEMTNKAFDDMPPATQFNTIYSDFSAASTVIQKSVFDEYFLVKDSLRKITWKITDETREIAGYQCRRANGLMMDSIYVVAFYTDKIPVSGGPESFSGLPGMILGVAMPHENMTWFATKINDLAEVPAAIEPPKKGKPYSTKQFSIELKSALKNWGKEGTYYMRVFSM
jgi:GLPGLI family protein